MVIRSLYYFESRVKSRFEFYEDTTKILKYWIKFEVDVKKDHSNDFAYFPRFLDDLECCYVSEPKKLS